jgi:hypothetical protein
LGVLMTERTSLLEECERLHQRGGKTPQRMYSIN